MYKMYALLIDCQFIKGQLNKTETSELRGEPGLSFPVGNQRNSLIRPETGRDIRAFIEYWQVCSEESKSFLLKGIISEHSSTNQTFGGLFVGLTFLIDGLHYTRTSMHIGKKGKSISLSDLIYFCF